MTMDGIAIGHNNPPSDAEILRDRLADTYASLKGRADDLLGAASRVPEVIGDAETAARVTGFVKQVVACARAAETARVAEKAPFLAQGAAVDGFFKSIRAPLDDVKKVIEGRLTAFQRRVADEERRRREEDAARQREEAQRLARDAAERETAVRTDSDLDSAIQADEAARQAAADAEKARREAAAKAAELSRIRDDYGAVASLRTFWDYADLDRATLDLEALRPHLPADALEKAVRAFIRMGGRELRGVRIFENTETRVR